MAQTPPHIQDLLNELRELLLAWDERGELGELAIVRGYHQWEVEERPRRKRKSVKHERGGKLIVRK